MTILGIRGKTMIMKGMEQAMEMVARAALP